MEEDFQGTDVCDSVVDWSCMYCNKFASSISQWKFITLKVRYTTVEYSSQLF
jgi:hypothetical protein